MPFDSSRALPYFTPAYSAEDTAPIRTHGSDDAPIVRVFSTTLHLNYMVDEPGALVFLRERDVSPRERDALHARAVDNLRKHVERRRLRFEVDGPLQLAKLDGQHDASLLLLDELWDPPTRIADFPGELVAAVPARSVVAFTGTGARGGVRDLRAWVTKKQATDRELSPEVFVRRHGCWETLEG